ncbi:uncharacterized protein LOC124653060 [Lolium rigidum]|uniref:uncharacterized protein LOC124653060 n=1 Tax=Lolium rigidum TaxID=89674 RepID=UPI001F5DF371|nr:uncharacterized protein LOC124653060 [Lolium rigidum]
MASLHAGLSTGRLRIYTPALYDDGTPWQNEREQDSSQLLLKIHSHYKEALDGLTGSDVVRRFLPSGVCVGLLDPVSNITVNALLAATADKAYSAPVAVDLGDTERRSLDGLVTFLTCFFPYLADWEAVRYLLLADADPLVAARIVLEDRGTKCFRPDSAATNGALRLALRCATLAAKQHPQLADAWLSLCSSLHKAVPNYHHNIFNNLRTLFKEKTTAHVPYPPPTGKPWELAATRRTRITKVPYQHSWSLRRVLLDAIHGFYLKALARMPGGSRYHRSMLKAGHCYGPFDPVSNIILNTIWYEANFPPLTPQRELDFVGTWSLMRIEALSFYGLLSFLCTCHQDLSMHEAMRILIEEDLNLSATKHCSSVKEEQDAYRAAAIAAWCPRLNSDAQAGFLSSCNKPQVLSLLSNGGQQQLSSQAVQQIATLLASGMTTQQQQQQPLSVSKREFDDTMSEGSQRRRAHKRISKKVKGALRRYEKQNSGDNTCYQLYVVCGVNESVSGPDNSEESIKKRDDSDDEFDDYYHHTHANFLVTRNVGSVCSVPVLFFAELSNDGDDDQLLCCPVDIPPPGAEPVRCLFCEQAGIRIVHPANQEGFHGRTLEFEKMVRGEDFYDNGYYTEVYSNHRILDRSESIANWTQGGDEEECMYLGSNDFTIKEDDGDESEDFEDD